MKYHSPSIGVPFEHIIIFNKNHISQNYDFKLNPQKKKIKIQIWKVVSSPSWLWRWSSNEKGLKLCYVQKEVPL